MDTYSRVYNHGWQSRWGGKSTSYDESSGSVTNHPESSVDLRRTFVDSAQGVRNPSWRQQVRSGQNATTAFTGTATSKDPRSFFSVYFDQRWLNNTTKQIGGTVADGGGYYYPLGPTAGSPSSSVITHVENRCIAKFLEAAESVQSSIEAGQDIGEYKETVHSIRKPLSTLQDSLISYLSQLRKLKKAVKKPAALRKIVADTYLEYHFGWQPLVADVAALIADAGHYRFPSYPVKAKAKEDYQSGEDFVTFGVPNVPNSLHAHSVSTSTYRCRIKGAVRARNYDNGQSSLASSLQLTPDRWLPTAWDLLPYSWIGDYFTNIGDIFQGLCFISSSLIWGAKTTRNVTVRKVSDFTYDHTPLVSGSSRTIIADIAFARGGNYECSVSTVTRSSVQGIDLIPTIEFRLPDTKYPFLNMGALLLQRSKGIIPLWH